MPPYKSALNLIELCWNTFLRNFDKLEHKAERLTPVLINELFRRFCVHFYCRQRLSLSRKLPAKLFIRPTTKELLALTSFDLPEDEVIKKIIHTCTRLRKIKIQFGFVEATKNTPHLVHLDLRYSQVTDIDLRIISERCSQLQHLDLRMCKGITDDCVRYLPPKLAYINLLWSNVTKKGCVVALNALQSLKQLEHDYEWIGTLRLLRRENWGKTYSIEKLQIISYKRVKFDFCELVTEFFPKLTNFEITYFSFKENLNTLVNSIKNNITALKVLNTSMSAIKMVANFCPMLQEFTIVVRDGNFTNDDKDVALKPIESRAEHVPFKHLRKLSMDLMKYNLSRVDFLLLFRNSHNLEVLEIDKYGDGLNEMLFLLTTANPLCHLKHLIFESCFFLSINSVITTLKLLPSLKVLDILSSVSRNEFEVLHEFVKLHNLDVVCNCKQDFGFIL